MTKLSSKVNISAGATEVSWEVHPFYFTTDMTNGYLITKIAGHDFPANYFGKILHLQETATGFEYMEDDITAGHLDEDSKAVLEEIKKTTINGAPYS